MGLKDAVQRNTPRRGSACTIGAFLDTLTATQRDEFNEILPDVTATALTRGVKEEYGAVLATSAIGRHRRGECVCGSD